MLQDNINVFSKKELCFSYNAKYFAQRFNRPFDKNGNIRILTVFFTHRQGGITCGAIDEPRKSSKAIDERVIVNFRDKNAVIAHFGLSCHDLSCYVMICHEGAPSPLPALYATLSRI